MIFPGLNARFGGRVTAKTNFSFGFDTHGINEWRQGWNLNVNPWDLDWDHAYKIANGFFVDDHLVNGVDQPEVTLTRVDHRGRFGGHLAAWWKRALKATSR